MFTLHSAPPNGGASVVGFVPSKRAKSLLLLPALATVQDPHSIPAPTVITVKLIANNFLILPPSLHIASNSGRVCAAYRSPCSLSESDGGDRALLVLSRLIILTR